MQILEFESSSDAEVRHNIKKEEAVFAKIDAINTKLAKKDEPPPAAAKNKNWKKGGGGLLSSFTAAAAGPARQAYNSATTIDMEALNAQWRDQLMEAYSWVTLVPRLPPDLFPYQP